MDRRAFLRRLGIGGGAALAVGAPLGLAVGEWDADQRLRGEFDHAVAAGRSLGNARIWWSATTDEKVLALTFDDGPTTRFTPRVLDVLDRYDVSATFFVIGELVQRAPDVVAGLAEAGHEVANHTFDHVPAERQTKDEVRRTIDRGADAIAEVLGERPRFLRPVRGNITGAVVAAAAALDQELAIWSVTRGGFTKGLDANARSVADHLTGAAHPGAIVLLHDGVGRASFDGKRRPDLVARREAEVRALPEVVESYLADGYRFATVSELLAAPAG